MRGTYLPMILRDFDADGVNAGLGQELRHGGIGGGDSHTSEHTGTRALMFAVLEDGIRSFLNSNRREREEAEVWMTRRQDNWLFSFVNVCQTLGLDPIAVRRAVYAMRERSLPPRRAIGRSRPNSGRYSRISAARE